jgi:aquaporin Z
VQDGVQYWIAQVVGAVAGAGVLKLLLETTDLPSEATTSIGGNVINETFGTTGTFILEGLLAAAFVLVYLKVTEEGAPVVGSALTLGFTFAMTYLVAFPADGGGINPAKSLGAAIFEGGDTDALEDLWLFILAPLVGAVLAALVAPLLRSEEPTTTRTRESVPS